MPLLVSDCAGNVFPVSSSDSYIVLIVQYMGHMNCLYIDMFYNFI